ncbi:NAD(P)-dependent oxidoreductase [Fructobacillus ficulneus]|uniref:Putative NADH-flavin reductase n=1 Tax=Fructobacillus ficulneus TaxID=157463 RepID=A0A0K8MJR8_9LACO|nr:NAD(P)H-binding protein [Fructobacillus ficulneus]GAP00115.1 putative NADH-flavin reductase [Fructobacillus ficulneus]
MKVLVIGATGMAGSAIVTAALAAGDQVTANGRSAEKLADLKAANPDIEVLAKDAFDLTKEEIAVFDVVVDAFSAPSAPYLQIDLAAQLVKFLRNEPKPRLAFVLGASSLTTGEDNHLLLDDLAKVPGAEAWIGIPQSQVFELEFLRHVENVSWFGLSPANEFVAGPADPQPLQAQDTLLINDKGESKTTSGTLAEALVAEYHNPKYPNSRFTVANH